ncbi:hypothetical protein D039_3100A, partial [Vibrio parahaemolyticus EKP-028]
MSIGSY